MKLNWKIRFNKKNVTFLLFAVGSVVAPVLTYLNLNLQDFTTWEMLWKTILETLKNPYLLLLMLFTFLGVSYDPTTKNFKDSEDVLNLKEPK